MDKETKAYIRQLIDHLDLDSEEDVLKLMEVFYTLGREETPRYKIIQYEE